MWLQARSLFLRKFVTFSARFKKVLELLQNILCTCLKQGMNSECRIWYEKWQVKFLQPYKKQEP